MHTGLMFEPPTYQVSEPENRHSHAGVSRKTEILHIVRRQVRCTTRFTDGSQTSARDARHRSQYFWLLCESTASVTKWRRIP